MTFGERLKYILEFKSISQRDFSKMINTSESQLSKLLNNKKKPTLKEIETLVEVLKVPYDCLMGKIEFFDDLLEKKTLWRID